MKYEIVNLEQKLVEGLMVKTTNEKGKAIEDIAQLWQTFFTEGAYGKIEQKVNTKTIGLYTDYEGDYTKPYKFLTCAEVSKKSSELENRVTKVIPKGKYAKFVIIGDVQQAVGKLWSEIWQMDLQRSYTGDFEEYQNTSQDMTKQEIHVYIALK